MTDRIKGFTVTLSHDIREDDAESILTAIRMIRGVADVTPAIVTANDHTNRMQIRTQVEQNIYKAIRELFVVGIKEC